jgi:hypothetical protein
MFNTSSLLAVVAAAATAETYQPVAAEQAVIETQQLVKPQAVEHQPKAQSSSTSRWHTQSQSGEEALAVLVP